MQSHSQGPCLQNDTNDMLRQTQRCKEFLQFNELDLLLKKHTRQTRDSSSCIDVFITSTPNLFKSLRVLKTALSDHYPIAGIMNFRTPDNRDALVD